MKPVVGKLPSVVKSSIVTADHWEQINETPLGNAKKEFEFNQEKSQLVTYENTPAGFEFLFAPYANNPDRVEAFIVKNGKVNTEATFTLIRTATGFIAETASGKVDYKFDGPELIGIEVNKYPKQVVNNERVQNCDVFQQYLDCEAAVAQQFADVICGGCGAGQMAWAIACGYFAPCRWAAIVTCGLYVVVDPDSNCWRGN